MHDLIIEHAVIIDGLGNSSTEGDLAIKDGRIAAIGTNLGAAQETFDAKGLTLAPGIVDIHTHFDAQLTWDPYATPSNRLGVTTVVIGNCGFTIAPCKPEHRERTLRNLTHVEGMSLEAMQEGIDWDFVSFGEYMDTLERKGSVPNVAAFCGHSSVRTWVLGDDASDRAATREEVAQMKALVREAMEAGACGFATSTLEQHNGENGIPMPSRLADEHEMMELTGVLGEVGKGSFMLTKGMTSTIPWLESIAANNGKIQIATMVHGNAMDESKSASTTFWIDPTAQTTGRSSASRSASPATGSRWASNGSPGYQPMIRLSLILMLPASKASARYFAYCPFVTQVIMIS